METDIIDNNLVKKTRRGGKAKSSLKMSKKKQSEILFFYQGENFIF
jgi:hypothetical protein